ncbi:hypothetical protein J2736_003599 [Paenibacillus qinlingensis]|uniref:Uncharacterized protein n=2 Tax=Paenibacillus qinlingensis TaxID=1837343 RepID=A0ABU1NY19_9BACL|nr:hypothetical protein [Paenibacillus qinlingensis]
MRHQRIAELFRQAGFSFSWQKDIRVWYWFHFIMNAGMVREMLPLIAAKGGKLSFGTSLAMRMPAGLLGLGYAAFKVLRGNSVPAAIMERMERTAYISRESFAHFPVDVLTDARKLGVSLPRLEALEPYFK